MRMANKRKTGIVVRHLEHVSRKLLKQYQEVVRGLVRRRHGIYALYDGDRLYYVGLAADLRSRLKSHLRDRHTEEWDAFSLYLTEDAGHLRELEALLIRIAAPSGNRSRTKFGNAADLRRDFRR